jgi:protein tyrosine phosphatase (PTP) superfamily phosphohydrolase (DUF442 family)
MLNRLPRLLTLVLLMGCASEPAQTPAPAPQSGSAPPPPASAALAAPAAPASGEAAHPPLPNVRHLDDGIVSGGVPGGDAGFDALKAMGIRTIITVDGAPPDVARAEARGMRYVHIPITYAQVSPEQTLELARAVRDLPGPVYIHCHHGKHRSPAAAAAAAIALGRLTGVQGVAFLKKAGTAPSYEGLYACVSEGQPAAPGAIDGAPADFPPVRQPTGLVASMVDVDEAFDHVDAIRAAGWAVPVDHPDLVPAAEAGRLADDLRLGAEDPRAARSPDLVAALRAAAEEAAALEGAIVAGAPAADLAKRFAAVKRSCTECHTKWRNKR